ncbi:protein phosphatase 1 regulatory subunit 3B [Alosa pseudoharengus]|uniref:protein phosphatase 1 regulatory subunit 3B n=1 Tax=Alosa pseudoharengus TaxID=34774 RepID=UPI003F88C3BA
MPVDLAMPLFLANGDFHGKRCSRPVKALQPCLNQDEGQTVKRGCSQQWSSLDEVSTLKAKKKQVSFADHRGMALTRVKVFSEFEDPIDIPLNIQELLRSALSLSEKDTLVLAFTQPSSDYLLFRQRLERDYVCLEHCTLQERALAGTVKVKNLAFEKSVKLRITYDTWKSHVDVPCQYVKATYTDENRDTFAFEVSLSSDLRPHERIEFAVLYEESGVQHWDSNEGQNYRIVPSSLKEEHKKTSPIQNDTSDWGIHFDCYGSPRCSHGIFPDWPGYASYEEIGPYY